MTHNGKSRGAILALRAKHLATVKKEMRGAGWRTVGGKRHYFRSLWEANYAFYLEWKKQKSWITEWEHEPKTFWFEGIKRGCVSYLPDFSVTDIDGNIFWVEIKGWMDPKSKTKIKRFAKYFPEEKLIVIDAAWYKSNSSKLSKFVPGWR